MVHIALHKLRIFRSLYTAVRDNYNSLSSDIYQANWAGCLAAQKPFGLSKRTFTFHFLKTLLICTVFKCKIKALVIYK